MQELYYEEVRLRKEFNNFIIGGLFVVKVWKWRLNFDDALPFDPIGGLLQDDFFH